MKKIMTMMLGLSLLGGAVTAAFAQTGTEGTEKAKKKGKKKGTDNTNKSDKR